jgi:hypothetical protein
MAKRTRYPARPAARPAARPGAGRNGPGSASRPGTASPAVRLGGLTDAEVEKAAQFEAELVARERAAIADNARRRARGRGMDIGIAGDAGAPLSVRAAHEYAYVARDVRRIVRSGGLMLAILAAAWVVVNFVLVAPA